MLYALGKEDDSELDFYETTNESNGVMVALLILVLIFHYAQVF